MLSNRSSSSRKPLGDLTNKLSATCLDDRESTTSTKVSTSKTQISDVSEKKKDQVNVETVVVAEKTPDVSASQEEVVEEGGARPKVKSRPANLTNIGVSSLDNFPLEESGAASVLPAHPPSPLIDGSFFYLGAPSSHGFHLMTPLSLTSPGAAPAPPLSGSQGQDTVAYVMEPGYISLKLSHGVVLDISNDFSLRLLNPRQQSSISMCGAGDFPDVAIIHPLGRAIVYHQRAEIQLEDEISVKNAKFYQRGISFTANNLALVYQLDEAGARTTSDTFHDLHATNTVETLFLQRCDALSSSVSVSCEQLNRIQYWRTPVSCLAWHGRL